MGEGSSSIASFSIFHSIHGIGVNFVAKRLLRACLDATVPFRSPIQISLFLPFQNGKNALFTVETVAERNGPIFAKQALIAFSDPKRSGNPVGKHWTSTLGAQGMRGKVVGKERPSFGKHYYTIKEGDCRSLKPSLITCGAPRQPYAPPRHLELPIRFRNLRRLQPQPVPGCHPDTEIPVVPGGFFKYCRPSSPNSKTDGLVA